jgi:hypothetical protein
MIVQDVKKIVKLAILILQCLMISSCAIKYQDIPVSEQINYNKQKKAIVFVHGLTGNARDTWTNPETGLSFPNILLKNDFINENYAIHSINFPSHLINDNISLEEIGNWFAYELINEKIITNGRYDEIIFIAHSLGNLVVRSALYKNSEKFKAIKIPMIISLASPSEGSNLADIGKFLLPGNEQLSNLTSGVNNQYLTKLNKAWDEHKGDTKIACAYETNPLAGIGIVVSKNSATRVCTENSYPSLTDHFGISKPPSLNSRIVKWVINEILSIDSPKLIQAEDNNFKNAYYIESNLNIDKPDKNIQIIIECIKKMATRDSLQFLKHYDYSNMSEIKCKDAALLFDYVLFSDAIELIEILSPHIERPISMDCIEIIRNKIPDTALYDGMSTLTKH